MLEQVYLNNKLSQQDSDKKFLYLLPQNFKHILIVFKKKTASWMSNTEIQYRENGCILWIM